MCIRDRISAGTRREVGVGRFGVASVSHIFNAKQYSQTAGGVTQKCSEVKAAASVPQMTT